MAVKIGNIYIGMGHPVVIQSMTSTDTNDIGASVAQCIRIIDAGGEMVRLTTQGMREVESLAAVRNELRRRGYSQPLIADVHFLPKVAVAAARVAEKVRINPGNYVERKYDGPMQFTLQEQERQMADIRQRLLPLITACREHGTAVRVGVNHGSLSRRILSWYGDTPEGMVESALEFIRIFAGENFHNLVVSLKASDSRIMVYANRLLVKRMKEENIIYPLHLGVTEAGAGEDGILKSSAGIATLLAEGIGDTVRVSLTEDPEQEIPVAAKIVEYFSSREKKPLPEVKGFDPFRYRRRRSSVSGNIGGSNVPVVICGGRDSNAGFELAGECGYVQGQGNALEMTDTAADYIYVGTRAENTLPPGIHFTGTPDVCKGVTGSYSYCHPFFPAGHGMNTVVPGDLHFISADAETLAEQAGMIRDYGPGAVLVLNLPDKDAIASGMECYRVLEEAGMDIPVILHRVYDTAGKMPLAVCAAGETGALLTNGFGDGIWIEEKNKAIPLPYIREISFGILQAVKTRISGTEYIACPSCGRTLFNIRETLRKIKEATAGMKGLKIAVMGCIVNGPGEMADADYGYVGAGPGRVTLYKGHIPVKKNIPEEEAVEELLDLIGR